MKKNVRNAITVALCALALGACMILGACANGSDSSPDNGKTAETPDSIAVEADAHLSIVSLKGPTSIGMAQMMQSANQADTDAASLYHFEVQGTADAIVPLLVQGQVDIALIPANLAATLYQKTEGAISVIDVNTLGVLYAVSQNPEFSQMESLKGATVYMTGMGTVPQYTLDALLDAVGLAETDLSIEFKSEAAEVVAAISADASAVGILPQPYVSAACAKNAALQVTMNLTEQWDQLMGADAGKLLTGVTVVRNSALQQYPQAIAQFLADHAASVAAVNADPASFAQVVVDLGIIDNAAIAQAAIPACNTVCLTGADMKNALAGYLQTLYNLNPASIGGALPADDFYFGA